MSRNSSGTYTAPANSWNPAVEGSAIDETDWNSTLTDISSALTDSLDRTGKGKITAHIDFDENGSPGTPASNVGRLYVGDNGGVTTLYFKDASGNVYDLTQAATSGLAFTFNSTTTTNADPGTGKAAFNNATLSSATELAISTTTSGGADVAAFIATWDDTGTTDRGRLIVQKRTDPSKLYVYTISGANTDASGYKRIAITYVSGSGAVSNSDPISIAWQVPGATGATGPSGSMSGPGASVDGEIALYSGTAGTTLKRATTNGLLKASSGVLAQATAGTDYLAPPSGTSILKANSGGALANATGGTDYADLAFKTIAVSGQSNVVADSASDTLTLVAGSNVTITTDATTDTVTISASGGGGGGGSVSNLLVNGCMRLNQRQATSNADDTYAHDRWNILTQTGTVAASTQTLIENGWTHAMRITQSQASAQRFGVEQILESAASQRLRGSGVALSARVRMSASTTLRYAILEWTGTADTVTSDVVLDWTSATFTAGNFFLASNLTVTATGSTALTANTAATVSLTGTLGSSTNNVIVLFWTDSTQAQNVTLDIGKVQFEVSASASTFELRSISDELSRAQRFYEKTYDLTVAPGTVTNTGSIGQRAPFGSATNSPEFYTIFTSRKRVAPTVTFYNPVTGSGGTSGTAGNCRNRSVNTNLTMTMDYIGEATMTYYVTGTCSEGDFLFVHYTSDAEL